MKLLLCTFLVLTYTLPALAAGCRLEKPVPFSSELPRPSGLILRDVRVDENPYFTHPENYDPKVDTLELHLFNIERNGERTDYLGSNLSIHGKTESVGFSEKYSGGFSFHGENQDINGTKTYLTRSVSRYAMPGKMVQDGVTEMQVTAIGSEITTIILKFPIFRVVEGWNVVFTGKHQSLCIQSAR